MDISSLRDGRYNSEYTPSQWPLHQPSLRAQYFDSDAYPATSHSFPGVTDVGPTQSMMQSQSIAHTLPPHHPRQDPQSSAGATGFHWQQQYHQPPNNDGAFYRNANLSNGLPGISLPPLRTVEPNHSFSSHLAGPPMPMQQFPFLTPPMQSSQMGLMQYANGQYPPYGLISSEHKLFNGPRHKKEIKRRTKTGCLTCRKRRIKCDEQHPTCRNCQKSKRDCQGYEPLFKSASDIQPMGPSSASTQNSDSHQNRANAIRDDPEPAKVRGRDQGHAGDSALMVEHMTESHPSGSQYPTLQAGKASAATAAEQNRYTGEEGAAGRDTTADHSQVLTSDPRPLPSGIQKGAGSPPAGIEMAQGGNPNAGKVRSIQSICNTPEALPPESGSTITPPDLAMEPSLREAIRIHYLYHYAAEVDRFLETKWFQKRGLDRIICDPQLQSAFAERVSANPQATEATLESEARLFWRIISIAMMTAGPMISNVEEVKAGMFDEDVDIQDGLLTAAKRSVIVQCAITGISLESNPLPLSEGQQFVTEAQEHECRFWSALGAGLTTDSDAGQALQAARGNLENLRNRDITYSILVVRHLSGRVNEMGNANNVAMDENQPADRLSVARAFVKHQALPNHDPPSMAQCISHLAVKQWAVSQAKSG